MASGGVSLPGEVIIEISTRLAKLDHLRYPAQLERQDDVSEGQKKVYLESLLHRDPAVFLERYGKTLLQEERDHFVPLQEDYEVGFWLRATAPSPSSSQPKHVARNRRTAVMHTLEQGTYFGEEEMRQRAPLLHHFYVGQYDEETRRVPNPPRNLAESLLYLQDEAERHQRMEKEQAAWDEADLDVSEEESESNEEEESSLEESEAGLDERGVSRDRDEQSSGPAGRVPNFHSAGTPRGTTSGDSHAYEGSLRGSSVVSDRARGDLDPSRPGAYTGGPSGSGAGPLGGQAWGKTGFVRETEAGEGGKGGKKGREGERRKEGEGGRRADGEEEGERMRGEEEVLRREGEAKRAGKVQELVKEMKARFLAGEEEDVDYGAIDADDSLDEHWAREAQQDAEDKYFDED